MYSAQDLEHLLQRKLLHLFTQREGTCTRTDLRDGLKRAFDQDIKQALFALKSNPDEGFDKALLNMLTTSLEELKNRGLTLKEGKRWGITEAGLSYLNSSTHPTMDASSPDVSPPAQLTAELTEEVPSHQSERSILEALNAEANTTEVEESAEVGTLVELTSPSEPPLTVVSTREGQSGLKAILSAGGAEGCSFEEPDDKSQAIFKVSNGVVHQPITFVNCHFDYLHLEGGSYQEITFQDCTFRGPLKIDQCELKGALHFQQSTLQDFQLCGKSIVRVKDGKDTLLSCFLSLPSLTFDDVTLQGQLTLSNVVLPHLRFFKTEVNALNFSRVNHLGDDNAWEVAAPLSKAHQGATLEIEESVLKSVEFARVYFKRFNLSSAQLIDMSTTKQKMGLFQELRVIESELFGVELQSESPLCKVIVERSRLVAFSLDLTKSNISEGLMKALELTQAPHHELSFQDNLICGVTLKLSEHTKALSSTRDILSSEGSVKKARDFKVEGGALQNLTFQALMLDDGHLSLEGVRADTSSLDMRLVKLASTWLGERFVQQLKSIVSQGIEGVDEASAELVETPPPIEALSSLKDTSVRLETDHALPQSQNNTFLWGFKANKCQLKGLSHLSLPVRQVRLSHTRMTCDVLGAESLLFTISSDELTLKNCQLERLDLRAFQRGEAAYCREIKVERSQLERCSLSDLEASLIKFSSCELSQLHLDQVSFVEPLKQGEQNFLGLVFFMCKATSTQHGVPPLIVRGLNIAQEGVLSLDRSELQGAILAHINTPRFDLKSAQLINVKLSHIKTKDIRLWRLPKDDLLISPYLLNREGKRFLHLKSAHLNDISEHLRAAPPYHFESSETHAIAGQGIKTYIHDRDTFLLESKSTLPLELDEREEEKGGKKNQDQSTFARLRDHYPVLQVDDKLLEGLTYEEGEELPAELIQSILYQVRDLYEATLIKGCEFEHCHFLMDTQQRGPYQELYERIERLEDSGLQKIIKRPTLEDCHLKACELAGPVFKGLKITHDCDFSQGTSFSGEVLAHAHVTAPMLIDDCALLGAGTFKDSKFSDKLDLQDCFIKEGAAYTFDGAEFFGEVNFNHLTFEEQLSLRGSTFKRDLTLNRLFIQPSSREFLIDLEGARFEESLSLTLPRVKRASPKDERLPPLKLNLSKAEVKEKLDLGELYQDTWEHEQRDQATLLSDVKDVHPRYDQRVQLCLWLTRFERIITPTMNHELRSQIRKQVKLRHLKVDESPQGQPLAFYSSKLEGAHPTKRRERRRHEAKLALEHYEWLTLFERAARERQSPHEVGYYINLQGRLLTRAHSRLFLLPHAWLHRLVQRYQLDIYRVNGEKSWLKFVLKLFVIAGLFFTLHRFALSCQLKNQELIKLVTLEAWLSPVLSLLDINLESFELMKRLSDQNQIAHACQRLLSLLLLAPLVGLPHQLITHEKIAQQVRHHLRSKQKKELKTAGQTAEQTAERSS